MYLHKIMGLTIPVSKSTQIDSAIEIGFESKSIQAIKTGVSETTELAKLPAKNDEHESAIGYAAIFAGLECAKGQQSPKDVATFADNISKLPVDPFNVGGIVKEAGMESFDGKDISAVVRYSVAGAYKNAYIDDASELVFPTLTIDPRLNGFVIDIEVLEVKKSFDRYVGNTTAQTQTRTSLVKVINDLSALGNSDNLLIPNIVVDSTDKDYNEELFVKELKHNVERKDELIATAPLAFSKKVAFIDISQSPVDKTHGVMNDRDELGNVSVRELHIGVDPADKSKALPVSLKGFNYHFTPSFEGDEKGVAFAMNDVIVTYNTSKTSMSISGEAANTNGNIFDGLPDNLDVGIKLNVHATGNLRDGTFIFSSVKPEVVFVKTASGLELDLTTGDGKDVVDALTDIFMSGYELSAVLTNSNVRNRGIRGTVTGYSKLLEAPYKESDTIESPLVNDYDKLTDEKRSKFLKSLNAKISMTVIRTRQDGIVTLMNFFDSANNLAAMSGNLSSVSSSAFIDVMPSSVYVNPLIIDDRIDMVTALDSTRTGERSDDIMGVFKLRVGDLVDEMVSATNYDVAHNIVNPGEKIVVNIIGGSRVIRRMKGLDLGDNYIVRTAAISLGEMKDIFTVTLGTENPIKTANGKKELDILNFGVRCYAPTTYSSLTASGEETYSFIHNTPRYGHHILTPIGARIKVDGMDQVVSTKITANRFSV